MKKYAKLTPQGSRDFLFEECDDRKKAESVLSALYKENTKAARSCLRFSRVQRLDVCSETCLAFRLHSAPLSAWLLYSAV